MSMEEVNTEGVMEAMEGVMEATGEDLEGIMDHPKEVLEVQEVQVAPLKEVIQPSSSTTSSTCSKLSTIHNTCSRCSSTTHSTDTHLKDMGVALHKESEMGMEDIRKLSRPNNLLLALAALAK